MAKINILQPNVYNRIAAGEVVDRPYSVVKELVENSIDAGATEITIYVEEGGKQLVRVVDNGCGIERDDLPSAFHSHATSKISTAEDLNGVLTLGFRGEAIASIASVSKMTITSKTAGGKCYSLTSDGGTLGQIKEAAATEVGTDVRVETLFYNIPVRFQFLKKDKTEEAEITSFVSRFILNRSDIAFTYYANGKKVLQSFGGGDEEAMLSVYGAATLRECYRIEAEKHGVRIRGYIGNQSYSKPNKSYQNVFLNGRYVVNTTISSAINGAYASYLMKRQYPFYALHIDVPPQIVDVNVHPNKADVRFASNQTIYGCVYSVISAVLDGKPQGLEYIKSGLPQVEEATEVAPAALAALAAKSEPTKSISEGILEQPKDAPAAVKNKYFSVFDDLPLSYEKATEELKPFTSQFTAKQETESSAEETKKSYADGFIPMSEIGDYKPTTRGSAVPPPVQPRRKKDPEKVLAKFPDLQFERKIFEFEDPKYAENYEVNSVPPTDHFEENKRYLSGLEMKAAQGKIDASQCVYAGRLFNTYLMYEYGDDVYIIDQHAAHERLIFDSLKAQMQARYVVRQPMLVPYRVEVNAFEAAFIRERMDDLWDMGFTVKETEGGCFDVSEIPVDLQDIDLNKFFNEILADVNGYRSIKLEELLKDKLAATACKAAVKGGMELTRREVDELLAKMDGDMGLKCPHGRPVVVKMTKKQIEKMFKRIV